MLTYEQIEQIGREARVVSGEIHRDIENGETVFTLTQPQADVLIDYVMHLETAAGTEWIDRILNEPALA